MVLALLDAKETLTVPAPWFAEEGNVLFLKVGTVKLMVIVVSMGNATMGFANTDASDQLIVQKASPANQESVSRYQAQSVAMMSNVAQEQNVLATFA